MKYPYIGKFNEACGRTVLFYKDKCGTVLDGSGLLHGEGDYCSSWFEEEAKNITAEYLANTYGEVKSKEHAEFIVKLAEVNGFQIFGLVNVKSAKSFKFKGGHLLIFAHEIKDTDGLKQITIPLPPECESDDEWPKVGDDVQTSDGVGTVKLLPDSKGYYVISIKDEYYQYQFDELSKPKTPEQELREFLHLLWRENNEDFDDFADIAVLHLTKKGEGDE